MQFSPHLIIPPFSLLSPTPPPPGALPSHPPLMFPSSFSLASRHPPNAPPGSKDSHAALLNEWLLKGVELLKTTTMISTHSVWDVQWEGRAALNKLWFKKYHVTNLSKTLNHQVSGENKNVCRGSFSFVRHIGPPISWFQCLEWRTDKGEEKKNSSESFFYFCVEFRCVPIVEWRAHYLFTSLMISYSIGQGRWEKRKYKDRSGGGCGISIFKDWFASQKWKVSKESQIH